MTAAFVKYLCLFFCSLYTSTHIANIQIKKTTFFSSVALLSFFALFINHFLSEQYHYLPILLYICINFLYSQNARFYAIGSIISYGITYALLILCSFLISIIFYVFNLENRTNSFLLISIFSSLLSMLITITFFKIPRFKSGLPFLQQKANSFKGLLFSILIILADILTYITTSTHYMKATLIQLLACLLLIPFIAWWRSQLTKSYRQYLRDMETRELQTKVQQLSADNQRLSQIVHKDNKLITAMTSSVLGMIEQALTYSPERLSAYSSSLYRELLSLSSHRQDSLSQLSGTLTGQFHTGYMMLDSVLNLQAKQAHELGVDLSVEHNDAFFQNIFSFIDEEQLAHITADLVQNAIIATQKSQNKSVEISFISNTNTTSIQVSDSGVEFPAIVLDSLGRERCSQHLQDGGSGIGLMDIWALKNTARATLLIEEFPDGATFTKRVHIIFDNKNRFIIMSDRKDELSTHLHRPDVIVLAPSK